MTVPIPLFLPHTTGSMTPQALGIILLITAAIVGYVVGLFILADKINAGWLFPVGLFVPIVLFGIILLFL